MRRLLVSAVLAALAFPARAELKIAATTPDLADIAARVGGGLVRVEALSKGSQDPHFVEAKPSLFIKLMAADLFIQNGLELEAGWAPSLLQGARNPRIRPGSTGFLDASLAVQPMEAMADATRALGDVHPGGNPHYLLDPENARLVARAIAARLAELSPGGAAAFQANLGAFEAELDRRMKTWSAALAPYRGKEFVSYHRNLVYFAARFGLVSVGELEPKPGVPPTAAHTAGLIERMRARRVPLVLTQAFYEDRSPLAVARAAGARVVVMAMGPGGTADAADYFAAVDHNVRAVAEALSQ